MKKAVFIGGGASSLVASIYLKKLDPSFDVTIVEKEKKLGKKLAMTGGGKCNIAPNRDDPYVYNASAIKMLESMYKEIPLKRYLEILEEVGIMTKTIKDYGYYPIHESAPQVVKNLYHQINKLGIKVIYDEMLDYEYVDNKIVIKLNEQIVEADYLLLGMGGLNKEAKQLFESHHIKVSKLYPGLCPVKVKENVNALFGTRFEASITLWYKKNIVKVYYGEVMFKKDGLSGIPVLNLSSLISRKMIIENADINDFQISVGLPRDLIGDFTGKNVEEALLSLFRESYADYLIKKHNLNGKDVIDIELNKKIVKMVSNEYFNVSSLYDFKDAQVTVGGVILNQINEGFALKNEKNTYILGESLNVDGICGGYNLRFAITSGLFAVNSILQTQK